MQLATSTARKTVSKLLTVFSSSCKLSPSVYNLIGCSLPSVLLSCIFIGLILIYSFFFLFLVWGAGRQNAPHQLPESDGDPLHSTIPPLSTFSHQRWLLLISQKRLPVRLLYVTSYGNLTNFEQSADINSGHTDKLSCLERSESVHKNIQASHIT